MGGAVYNEAMSKISLLSLAALLGAAPVRAQLMGTLNGANDASRGAAGQADPNAAKDQAGTIFDTPGSGSAGFVSPPPVLAPVSSPRQPSADLIVGEPGKHRIAEPKNPLTSDGKPVKQGSGQKLWWGLGGVAAGAAIGFLIGGPIGAAIGAAVLGALAWFFAP